MAYYLLIIYTGNEQNQSHQPGKARWIRVINWSTIRNRLQMKSKHKKISLLFLLGIAISGILYTAVCAPWCPSDQPDIDLPMGTVCSYLTHFFGTMETGLSRLFVFVFMSLFFMLSTLAIPGGFFLPPYRPPRRLFWPPSSLLFPFINL